MPRVSIRFARSAQTTLNTSAALKVVPRAAGCAREFGKEVNSMTFSFSDWAAYLNARFNREEGQTMAEYGVVLAVITLIVVVALGLLSTTIGNAIDSVITYL